MLNVTTRTGTLAVVALPPRMDSNAAPALDQELETLVRAGAHHLVLDFGAVTFLASAGLRLLLRQEKICTQAGGALVLASITEPVRVVLDVAGFAPHFHAYPDAAAARAALGV
jgi:anti-anti-sigma factor